MGTRKRAEVEVAAQEPRVCGAGFDRDLRRRATTATTVPAQ
jgi:hypothetical protein